MPHRGLAGGRSVQRGKWERRGEQGRWMVETSILSVTESLGKWIVVDFQLGDLGVLVGSDCHKLSVCDGDGDLWQASWLNNNLHHVLVHSVEQHLQGGIKFNKINNSTGTCM